LDNWCNADVQRLGRMKGSAGLCVRLLKTNNTMREEIKKLKSEIKDWQSQEVRERFERVNSQLHIVTIKEMKYRLQRLKRGEDI